MYDYLPGIKLVGYSDSTLREIITIPDSDIDNELRAVYRLPKN